MKYAHKFVHYCVDFGYKVNLYFSNEKLTDKEVISELINLCIKSGDEVEDELSIEPLGDPKIADSKIKMYTESMGKDDWFWCYCGTEEIVDTAQKRLNEIPEIREENYNPYMYDGYKDGDKLPDWDDYLEDKKETTS